MFDSGWTDPRTDGRFPPSGTVTVWHADKKSASDVLSTGISGSEGGLIWVASGSEIALLHDTMYEVRSLAKLEVEASVLDFERSHDDLHLFSFLDDVEFTVVACEPWDRGSDASDSDDD